MKKEINPQFNHIDPNQFDSIHTIRTGGLVPLPENVEEKIPTIPYKYNEGQTLKEISDYIDGTYGEHYSHNNYQATEFIIDGGHGTGFCVGNILKYAQRYGHKGTPAEWRKDMMKVIHYAIIQLHVHDLEYNKEK